MNVLRHITLTLFITHVKSDWQMFYYIIVTWLKMLRLAMSFVLSYVLQHKCFSKITSLMCLEISNSLSGNHQMALLSSKECCLLYFFWKLISYFLLKSQTKKNSIFLFFLSFALSSLDKFTSDRLILFGGNLPNDHWQQEERSVIVCSKFGDNFLSLRTLKNTCCWLFILLLSWYKFL
jgi:hypothetical protein